MIYEIDYLRELTFLCVNPLTWLVALILTRKNMNISTVLLAVSSCQILSITLPYLLMQNSALMFSVHSTLILFLLSLCTGCSIGFLVYGILAPREHTRRLSNQ